MNWNYKVYTAEEYLEKFPTKQEEVQPVVGLPTFVSAHVVISALKTNCIAMDDDRSNLGKLHCIMDTSNMETAVVASTNPGELSFAGLGTEELRANHLATYSRRKELWESDNNLKEAAKQFLLSRFEAVYFQELSDPITKFKRVTIANLIDHIKDNYPPEPEEINAVETTLRQEWDPTNHIENLFQSVKENTETLYEMKYITKTQMHATFIKYVYAAVRNSGQFESACIKWKALPSADKKTNKQCRAFFGKKYNVYHTSQNSLGLAGVANSAQQVQELEQVTHNGFRAIGERQNAQSAVNTRQEEINASVMQMIAARGGGMDDNATAFSAMTANSAVQDRRIAELEALLRTSAITPTSATGTGGNTGTGGGRGGRGGGRGGRGGRGGNNAGGGVYKSRADGPDNCTKNSKFYTAETYCWSHGYDCSTRHHSGSCFRKEPGHMDAATGANPMGGSIKDKEFSKWA